MYVYEYVYLRCNGWSGVYWTLATSFSSLPVFIQASWLERNEGMEEEEEEEEDDDDGWKVVVNV